MSCEKVRDLLSLYIDGELDADTLKLVEEHLNSCDECAAELAGLKRTVELCRSLEEVEVPAGFRATLVKKVAEQQQTWLREERAESHEEHKAEKRSRSVGLFPRLLASGPRQALAIAAIALVLMAWVNVAMGTLQLPFGGPSVLGSKAASAPQAAKPGAVGPQSPSESKAKYDVAVGERTMKEELARTSGMPAPAASPAIAPEGKGSSEFISGYYDMTQPVERQIIRRASLQVETGKERFDEASKQVMLTVESFGGFIQDSTVFTEADGKRVASFSIRVPEANFTKVLAQIESLGKVITRSIGSQDVTEQTIDVEAQLNNKERQQARLLELLGKAKTLDEILRIESELNRIRSEIDSFRGRLKYLKNAVAMSSIHLTLRESATKIVPQPPNLWRDAWQAFLRSARSLVIFIGQVLPFLIAGWFVWFLYVIYKKK